MDITFFLASLWGPLLIAIGLGFFISPKYYTKMYSNLEKSPFAVLFFGMVALVLGIMLVQMHNMWNTLPQIVVSILGWGLLLKGVTFVVMPHLADEAGDWAKKAKAIPMAGGVAFLVGAYLSWLAYFV